MPDDLYLRRDRSALSSGVVFRGGRRRRRFPWLAALAVVVVAGAALVFWQFNTVQTAVLAVVGIVTTPTPTVLESARQGDLAFWRGDLNASVDYYRQAVALAPENLDITYELIRMLIYRSYADERNAPDIDAAVELAEGLLDAYPDHPRALAIHCFALTRARRAEVGAQSCNRAISLDPNNADAYAYLALAYYDLGRLDSAAEAGLEALARNPSSIEANTAYGFVQVSLRRADPAIQYFIRAAQINPRLEYPYFNMGGVALGLGLNRNDPSLYQLAVSAYDTILAMNSRNVKAYSSLCQVYLATGERNLARDNCLTATELDETYTRAWRWLGEVYYRNMEYEAAIAAFDRCMQQEAFLPAGQRQPECWYYHGLAYVQTGNCPRALPIFTDVLGWTQSTRAIELVNQGVRICTGGRGFIPTATPVGGASGGN